MADSKYSNPAKQLPVKLVDSDVGYRYIEFPEDVFFMESLAQNASFRNGIAYIPVQRHVDGEEESHLYSISLDSDEAKHIAGPITTPDGSGDITIFGSALSHDGWLYLCSFNRNSILAFDLKTIDETAEPGEMRCTIEYEGVPSPNDVCTDPNDPYSLYVCAGTFRNLGCVEFSNAAYGQIYVIKMDKEGPGYNVQLISTGHKTLAGCEVANGKLWVAQLFNMFTMAQEFTAIPQIQWVGDDAEEMVWMADNIDVFDDDIILCPAYTRAPKATVDRFMKRPWLSSTILFFVQMVSACLTCEPLDQAFRDPEVALAFSNTYIKEGSDPEPVRLIFIKPDGSAFHFEVDLKETRASFQPREITARDDGERFIGHVSRGNTTAAVETLTGGDKKEPAILGKRHHFNEQVTHAAHLTDGTKGYVACVNFEQPRILLLDDKIFRDTMSGSTGKSEGPADEQKTDAPAEGSPAEASGPSDEG